MVSNKLRYILKKKKITIKELAERIGVTDKGMGLMLKTNSFKVENLQKISKVLQVPMKYWFEEVEDFPGSHAINEENANYGFNVSREVELLEKRIADKNQTIDILLKENARLQNMLDEYKIGDVERPKRKNAG